MPPPSVDVLIAGGGAAGFFAAAFAARTAPGAQVLIVEKSRELLAKVAISGGGRCNVTHACFDPRELIGYYPRGGRELRGPFHRFQPTDTLAWFESRGVALKTEEDGRIFPVSDDSGDIIRALRAEMEACGVEIRLGAGLTSAAARPGGFQVELQGGARLETRTLILATGGNRASGGWEVARRLGHRIVEPVPSLFSFHVRDPLLAGLAGIAVDSAAVRLPASGTSQRGAMLITHQGLSGPAILKLSAWEARALAESGYTADLEIDWTKGLSAQELSELFSRQRREQGARRVGGHPLFGLPRRLWERLCGLADIAAETTWARLPAPAAADLVARLTASRCRISGKSLNKEEFVTCGGVALDEVNMKTFESRLQPGLFFAGEVLDIDGVTGGFNFQAAWTGGFHAGSSAGTRVAAAGVPTGQSRRNSA